LSACGILSTTTVNRGRKKHSAILFLSKREIKRDFTGYRNQWSNPQQISLIPSFPKRADTIACVSYLLTANGLNMLSLHCIPVVLDSCGFTIVVQLYGYEVNPPV
jgi:hypothetical protein